MIAGMCFSKYSDFCKNVFSENVFCDRSFFLGVNFVKDPEIILRMSFVKSPLF